MNNEKMLLEQLEFARGVIKTMNHAVKSGVGSK
jgi:hypothetical protein